MRLVLVLAHALIVGGVPGADSQAQVLTHAVYLPRVTQPFTITVSTTLDEVRPDGACSLREAILAVNSAMAVDTCPGVPGPVTIVLPAGTYGLTPKDRVPEDGGLSGDLDITSDLTIIGADGVVIAVASASWFERVLDILPGSVVTLTNVRIRGGIVPESGDDGGGGIRNAGTLNLTNVSVTGNSAGNFYSGDGVGGGIANFGTLSMINSRVSGNRLIGCGGTRECDGRSDGGGVYNSGTLSMSHSLVDNNVAEMGAGGGIHNAPSGRMVIINSTIAANTAGDYGDVYPIAGIYNAGEMTLINSTVADNAPNGVRNDGGQLRIMNTLLARNEDADCVDTIVSEGYNLVQDLSPPTYATCTLIGTTTGNLVGVDAGLDRGGLNDNGGLTPTLALLPNSKAIDAGSPASPGTASACATTDQRGAARPADGNADRTARCDIGAFERQPGDGTR